MGQTFDSGGGKLYDCALMSKHVPDFINPLRAAEGRHNIAGPVAFTRMARLGEVVKNPDGDAEVDLKFAVDEQGIPNVRGRIRSEVVLICQRCLEPMTVPVDVTLDLGIVANDAEAKRLPDHYDPMVVGDKPVAVAELVEDEILLALPAIPRHDDGVCRAAKTEELDETKTAADNPFAVLAKLKSKH